MTGKRKKKNANYYYTQKHEDAVIAYASTDSLSEKNKIYEEIINPVFDELISKIVATFNFASLPNIESLKNDCKTNLVQALTKYDKDRGSKSYSYFSIIIKNFFIQAAKKMTKTARKEVQHEAILDVHKHENLMIHNDYLDNELDKEFFAALKAEVDTWDLEDLKDNEVKVLHAIKILFENADNIELLSKKAVYHLAREITDLPTKSLVASLKRFRTRYKDFKEDYYYD
jgi:ribosome-associated toxin RatA of RatAB toxin-antitoxin module